MTNAPHPVEAIFDSSHSIEQVQQSLATASTAVIEDCRHEIRFELMELGHELDWLTDEYDEPSGAAGDDPSVKAAAAGSEMVQFQARRRRLQQCQKLCRDELSARRHRAQNDYGLMEFNQ